MTNPAGMLVDQKAKGLNVVRIHSCLEGGGVLDVAGSGVDDGTGVILWTPTGNPNQAWVIDANGEDGHADYVRLIACHSGRMLARAADNAAIVDTWPGGFTPNLRWRIVAEHDNTVSIESANDGLVLAVASGDGNPGTRLIVYKRVTDGHGKLDPSQRFWLEGV